MNRSEVWEAIFQIVREAVERGQPNGIDVDKIFAVMGKLAPEPKPKPEVPWYNPKKVKRVGTLVERSQFTEEQREAARHALRAVGLL